MAELGVTYISVLPDTSKLAPALSKSTAAASGAAGAAGGKTFGGRFTSAVGSALKTAGKVGFLAAGAAAGATLVGGFKSAIDQAQSEKTLEGLYGSAKKAEKIMQGLRKVSKSSPIDYSSYTSTAEALAYMGVQAKDATPMLDNMGKMIVGAGGGSAELERAGDALLKMVNSGKVYAADLNQLSDTGIPVFSSLAEHLGTNIAGVRKMVSEGKVGIEDVQHVMQNVTGETAKKQVAAAAKVTGTLSNQFKILKDNIVVSMGGALRGVESFGAKALKSINSLFSGGGGGIKKALAPIGDALKNVLTALKPLRDALGGFFSDVVSAAKTAAPAFLDVGKALAPIAKFAATAVIASLATAFKILGPVLKVAASAFASVAKWMKDNRDIVAVLVSGLAAYKTAVIAQAAVTKGAAVATKAYAVAQRILNAAMRANPIGIVVTALTLLAGAAVVAYKRSATFRKIVNGAWAGIRKVVGAVWGWMKKTLWPGVKGMFSALGSAAKWLWNKAIKPAFKGIKVAAGILWKGIKLYFSAWKFYFTRVLFPVIKFLWHKVVKPVFKFIGKAVRFAWNSVIKPALKGWKSFFTNILFPTVRFLWNKVVKPVFSNIGKAISFAWHKVIKPVFGFLRKGIRTVGGVFEDIGDVIGNVWEGVKSGVTGAVDWVIRRINDLIKGINKVSGALNKIPGVNIPDIGLLQTTEERAAAEKERRKLSREQYFWQRRRELNRRGDPRVRYADGGPVSGPGTGTSDSIPAMLSNGEYVISSAMVKKYGPGLFDALNSGAAKVDAPAKFAMGGFVGGTRSGGNGGSLASSIQALVQTLRSKVVPALLKGGSGSTSAPKVTIDNPVKRSGKDGLKGFDKSVKKTSPLLKGFVKDVNRSRKSTVGMEMAVGKSAKKMGKYWTALRQGPVRNFSKDWNKKTRAAEKNAISLEKRLARSSKRMGGTLKGFRSGPLRGFSKDFGTTIAKRAPGDMETFRKRSLKSFSNTSKGMSSTWTKRMRPMMRDFGQYPRKDVAPAFGKGVDAIGGQWDRVKNKMRSPVKFAVNTVLNKGLLAAFNKIAKFVDTDTIKPIKLPKGFARGGYTGPGGKYQPAGIVHAGEYVINKESTSKLTKQQPGLLDRLNGFHKKPAPKPRPGQMPGYWVGGGVAPIPGFPTSPSHGTNYESSNWASDYGIPVGTPIRAWKEGRVVKVKQSNVSYGNETVINHPKGQWTRYAHQLKQLVNAGDKVKQGQRIGLSGDTGNSTGPHLHLEIGSGQQPFSGGTGGGMPALPPWAQKIANGPKKWAKGLLGDKLKGDGFKGLAQGMLDKLISPSADWATEQLGSAAYSGPMAGSVKRFVPTVKKVLGALGEKAGPTLLSAIMARMQKESGGNVGIVNQWDSNAAAGHPSVGLMQVIGPTYQSNKPNPDKGPYKYGTSIDPYSNIYAGLHYARGRYGSIYRGMTQPGGYDKGGVARGVGIMPKHTIKPERVLEPRQTAAFERMVARDFQPNAAGRGGWQEIRITNWNDGRAMIRNVAAGEMGSQQAFEQNIHRMGLRNA